MCEYEIVCILMNYLDDYERMNIADALLSKTYGNEDVIIRQVNNKYIYIIDTDRRSEQCTYYMLRGFISENFSSIGSAS